MRLSLTFYIKSVIIILSNNRAKAHALREDKIMKAFKRILLVVLAVLMIGITVFVVVVGSNKEAETNPVWGFFSGIQDAIDEFHLEIPGMDALDQAVRDNHVLNTLGNVLTGEDEFFDSFKSQVRYASRKGCMLIWNPENSLEEGIEVERGTPLVMGGKSITIDGERYLSALMIAEDNTLIGGYLKSSEMRSSNVYFQMLEDVPSTNMVDGQATTIPAKQAVECVRQSEEPGSDYITFRDSEGNLIIAKVRSESYGIKWF